MLRVFSNGIVRAIFLPAEKKEAVQPPPYSNPILKLTLPPIMRESTIRFRHTVSVFLFFYRRAPIVRCVD